MATRVTLNTVDGELVVDKVALEGDRPDRTAEARWLANARSPHVVRLISFEHSTIRTRHAGQTTLRTATATPPEAAGLLLGLARTLTDLHGRGLVHGKLTLDHVIVAGAGDRPNGIVLCSPDGSATSPSDDLVAFGELIERLLERWDSKGIAVAKRREWNEVRSRLTHPGEQITAQRVARWMAPLVVSAPSPSTSREADADDRETDAVTHRWRGTAVVVAGVLAIIGVAVTNPLESSPPELEEALELRVGNQVFAVDGSVGSAAGSAGECPPEAAVLDDSAVVWHFTPTGGSGEGRGDGMADSDGLDGAVGHALATVPGATELAYEDCELWAIGPAGRTKLDVG